MYSVPERSANSINREIHDIHELYIALSKIVIDDYKEGLSNGILKTVLQLQELEKRYEELNQLKVDLGYYVGDTPCLKR